MAAERAELVPYIQYDEHLPLDQWRPLNRNPDWTAIHLLQNGERSKPMPAIARRRWQLLGNFAAARDRRARGPMRCSRCWRRTPHIPPHVGVSNARLVCHLPLIVPEAAGSGSAARRATGSAGEAFVFDDTIEHEALNPSDELRVVLIFDIWHPDLSETEREAVAALIEAKGELGGSRHGL